MSKSASANGARVFLALWKSWKAVESYDRSSIGATGLGFSDFAVLEVCLHRGPLPVNTIGRKVHLTSGSISTAVDRLEGKKLVRRQESDDDARVTLVELTPKGRLLIERVYREHAQRLDLLSDVLGSDERRQLVRLLTKLGRHAETIQAPQRPAGANTFNDV
ncbi:MAG: MarR family transcriptional regulator [Candidatus Methylacidiphilales bacterium]|nr:MarR family transcriptional regulator [Candidatus Methylacidiphilales bacterium]